MTRWKDLELEETEDETEAFAGEAGSSGNREAWPGCGIHASGERGEAGASSAVEFVLDEGEAKQVWPRRIRGAR